MKVAILTTDSREHFKDYGKREPYFGSAPEALLEGFARLPEVEVHVISCARVRMTSPKKIAPNIFFHGLYVPKFGWMRTAYQGCIRAVRRTLRDIQPRIVHGQGTEMDCAMGAIFSGFPNVVTIHGNVAALARQFRDPPGSFMWWAGKFETFTLKRTSGVLCNSEFTERLVRPRARRTWRIPNPVREIFLSDAPSSAPAGRCTLVNVGVISSRKRQMELLEVARELRQQGLEFQFQFVGQARPDHDYVSAFLEKMKPLEREGAACCVGMKSGRELVEWLDQSHGLVHSSPAESFGLVVAEGLARNLKVFAARVGGVPDIVAGAPGGELFEMDDWRSLTAGIANWIRSGYPRAQGAQALMRARYDPELIARRHVEIYREVLGGA